MVTRSLELVRDPAAASIARSWLVDVLRAPAVLSGPAQADLLVMASELVANVMAHTQSDLRLTISCDDDEVRIAVTDDDPGEPTMQEVGADRVGGNGLRIVDAWSRSWGIERRANHGKTVWFTVATTPA
ncbi:hypothetical protein BH10ACT1_BH10ACT1_18970 [soil metagenome]